MTRKLDLVTDDANVGDLAAQIETLRSELATLATSVSELVTKSSAVGAGIGAKMAESAERTAARASGLAGELAGHSMESLAAAGDKAKDASLQLLDAVAAEVRKNPGRTLAVALGVGMILGLLSRSSK